MTFRLLFVGVVYDRRLGWEEGSPNLATRPGPPGKTVMRATPVGVAVRTATPRA
jgi:hypothetical protein